MQHYPIWKFLINRWFCSSVRTLRVLCSEKRLIFGPFKGPGGQFNTLEKCSVLKFLQAGFARVLRRPIETAGEIGKVGCSTSRWNTAQNHLRKKRPTETPAKCFLLSGGFSFSGLRKIRPFVSQSTG